MEIFGRGLFLTGSAALAVAAKERVTIKQGAARSTLVEHSAEVLKRDPKRASVGNHSGYPFRSFASCHFTETINTKPGNMASCFFIESAKRSAVPRDVQIKSFLPQREIEICQRVREVRLAEKWSQPIFAKELGITRERLASYEYAKAPIVYELGRLICNRLNVNQRWLAEGRPPMRHCIDVSPHAEALFPVRILFSEAYDKHLKGEIDDRIAELEEQLGAPLETAVFDDALLDNWPPVGAPLAQGAEFYLKRICGILAHAMPPEIQAKFFGHLITEAQKFSEAHKNEMRDWLKESKERADRHAVRERENNLTLNAGAVTNQPMPSWPELKRRVEKLTEHRGAKTILARRCKVTRQAVTTWLKGNVQPGAEATLRLLDWVTEEEAKPQKSGNDADTSNPPKTQTKEPTDENRKSKRTGQRK